MVENVELGLNILLTGIVIVFSVLVLLICVIKLYSLIVVSIQNSVEKRSSSKADKALQKKEKAEIPEVSKKQAPSSVIKPSPAEKKQPSKPADDGTIPGEIVAAIAAAVEVVFGEQPVAIKSIKKSSQTSKRHSVWKSAGMAENTRSF